MAVYKNSSPYYKTKIVNNTYLDILSIRPIPAEPDDVLFVLKPQYMHRPDLLAYDLYNDHKLWWVFAQRNLDVIQDPVFDFIPGLEIYLPKASNLATFLGL